VAGLRKRALEVPKEVSVTGLDGTGRASSQPDLTTIQIPFRETGMTGTERLAALPNKRFHRKQHVYISGPLRGGKTVAAPPK
jgi:DNA-binding LacI/PurR family transcriptional regulator